MPDTVMKPHFSKTAEFKKVFPHELLNNEWKVKWPVRHKNGKTYNPDFFSPALGSFIELCTSWENYAAERLKWQRALILGYELRIYWWDGQEITSFVEDGQTGSIVRHALNLAR